MVVTYHDLCENDTLTMHLIPSSLAIFASTRGPGQSGYPPIVHWFLTPDSAVVH